MIMQKKGIVTDHETMRKKGSFQNNFLNTTLSFEKLCS